MLYCGSSSSSSFFPHITPVPVGPNILCPENAIMSAPSSFTFISWCGAVCAVSSSSVAPCFFVSFFISFIGIVVPSRFDVSPRATILIFPLCFSIVSLNFSIENSFSSFVSIIMCFSPFSLLILCHGSRFELCSLLPVIIMSPFLKGYVLAIRFIASVVFLRNIISSSLFALMNFFVVVLVLYVSSSTFLLMLCVDLPPHPGYSS